MDLNPPSSTTTQSTASLAPGFRFHPTDEELVRYYLRRKVTGKPFRFDAITEIDIYKSEPWDLPGLSKLKSRDLEWYFFGVLDKKYGNGSKTNRATEKGYWKTTGKDRPVFHKTLTVGMKKTLVYHSGRAPKGARSNWVMHEYRLVDEELTKAGINPREAFVLCRIFQKSGTGPKNGEQYGAPLVEDEWENDDLVMVPGEVAEVAFADDFYLDGDEIEQIPDSFYYGDEGIQVERQNTIDDPQEPLTDVNGGIISQEFDRNKLFHLPVQNGLDMKIVKHEYIGESSNSVDTEDVDYLIDEPFLDATINPPMDDGSFLEASDLSNPIRENHSSFDQVEDYLNFFDTKEDNSLFEDVYSSAIMESENLGCNEMPLFEQNGNGGTRQENVECKHVFQDQMPLIKQDVNGGAPEKNVESDQVLQGQNNDAASTSNHESSYYELAKEKNFPDIKYHPYLKQAGCMLGKSSEFPSKGLSLGSNHSSSSIHVTAGMIHIRNLSVTVDGTYWPPRKNLEVDIVLPFGNSQIYEDGGNSLLSKPADPISPIWYYLMILIWVMILPLSFKIGTCFYTGKAF